MSEPRTDIQKSDTGAVQSVPEPTHSGPVYTPTVDIFETESAITVLADMPGVEPDNLTIDLRESVLTLVGRVPTGENKREDVILREHCPGTFMRQFTLSEAIDQSKIDARLSDGVLRLELPKVEKAKPRQISVRAS
jgi:HSP20 family molecular chaperone IbpA